MRRCLLPCAAVVLAACITGLTGAGERGPDPQKVKAVISKARGFLKSRQQPDGSFSPKGIAGPGVTALVAASLLRSGVSPQDPVVAKALAYLEKKSRDDGGIYDKALANYVTSIAVMAFKEANTDGRYDTLLKNAAAFLKKLQHNEPESLTSDVNFGGFGYDKKSRPDMSNTGFAVEALLAAGVSKDDPAIKNALKFLSRCQNLPGETNDQEFAKKTTKDDKGGFTYNPAGAKDKDEKKNPYRTPEGGLRSVGGMTYGGLKSFLYAGVSKDDPRVKAAVKWIRHHYTLEQNPGMGKAGLYYYYHTFAKAMDALGEEVFTDADGKKHPWRGELFATLKAKQQEDGSWINQGERLFGEGDPNLATAFAVLSLSYCRPATK
jgi:squalene-hopene/tetraprenyl-beta-curcumene cyclase